MVFHGISLGTFIRIAWGAIPISPWVCLKMVDLPSGNLT